MKETFNKSFSISQFSLTNMDKTTAVSHQGPLQPPSNKTGAIKNQNTVTEHSGGRPRAAPSPLPGSVPFPCELLCLAWYLFPKVSRPQQSFVW